MPSPSPKTVRLPAAGIWRVGWAKNPLHPQPPHALDLADTDAGNRFDSITADFETIYYGKNHAACFAEILAHRRPDPAIVELIDDGDSWTSFMRPGTVEAAWRRKRLLCRVALVNPEERFLDLHDHRTLAWLNRDFRPLLVLSNLGEVTVDSITKGDRMLTRYLASWLYKLRSPTGEPLFAGIKYLSRHGSDLECWALFDRTQIELRETMTIGKDNPDLKKIADLFGLIVF
jgi:RES domain